MIAASEDGGADHMKLLTKLARALVNPEFVEQLRQAPTRKPSSTSSVGSSSRRKKPRPHLQRPSPLLGTPR